MKRATTRLGISDHSRDSAGLKYVYPVVSRRAGGVSIGINLNPNNACNWRCIYCQVPNLVRGAAPPIDLALLERELRGFLGEVLSGSYLAQRVSGDARRLADVAISGNGEPTSAAEFAQVVSLLGRVREETPAIRSIETRLITNGSLVGRDSVAEGLSRLAKFGGETWFKVDAGTAEGIRRINDVEMTPERVVRNLRRCADLCPTWVQTCVFRLDGRPPGATDLEAYVGLLREAGVERLRGVHLYGLARPPLQPEAARLSPLRAEEMDAIGQRLREAGLTVRVSP
jgi:wyosine [tRNA(Phe)-imidazoG37] synthetase (radical SAM superfamily)